MNSKDIIKKLKDSNLKITPQRVVVYKSMVELRNHPTVEEIFDKVRRVLPNIAVGTVYNILETFIVNKLIEKISTRDDRKRYDIVAEKHHHLFCIDTGQIVDYFDYELEDLVNGYLKENHIRNFNISGINIQISGKFEKTEKRVNNNRAKIEK